MIPPLVWIVDVGPTLIVTPGGIVPEVICEAETVVALGMTVLHVGRLLLSSVKTAPGPVGAYGVAIEPEFPTQIFPGGSAGNNPAPVDHDN
jgi:hypothetical protein